MLSHTLLSLTLPATPVPIGFLMFNVIIIVWHFDRTGTAILAMRFAVPGTFSPFFGPVCSRQDSSCVSYVPVRSSTRCVASHRLPRPHLQDLPIEPIDRKAYPWVKPAACALLGLIVLGSCGLSFSRLISPPLWAKLAIALSVLVAIQSMVFFFWTISKQRNQRLNGIKFYFPRITVFWNFGFAMSYLISYGAFAKTLPEIWHLVSKAPQVQTNYIIHETDINSGRRTCNREMTFNLTEKQLATTSLCGLPHSIFEDTGQGDLLVVVGQASWFGQSVANASVVRQQRNVFELPRRPAPAVDGIDRAADEQAPNRRSNI